ncbi:MAG: DUF4143 domain-containing protein [Bdellovibrionia bacterium]
MFPRLLKPIKQQSFFLLGPRGTGKSTWVGEHYPTALKIDLLNESVFQEFLRNPSSLEAVVEGQKSQTIIIDEVQRLPELLNEVHRMLESKKTGVNRKYQFILTGSSARKLRKSGVNLLAGRAWSKRFFPLTAVELGDRFNLLQSLKFGHLPEVYSSPDPKSYLKSYVGTYLREEIIQEAVVRNLSSFTKFLESAAFSQGGVVSLQSIARDCGVDAKTVSSYFTVLEDLLIGYRVPVFQKKTKRELTTHPKFYYFDVGVYRTLRRQGPLDSADEIEGASVESLVFQELNATITQLDFNYDISFYRTRDKKEVDFILYGESGFKAIEVKKSDRYRNSDLDSLLIFLDEFPQASAYLFYGGERRLKVSGIDIIPLQEALPILPELLR